MNSIRCDGTIRSLGRRLCPRRYDQFCRYPRNNLVSTGAIDSRWKNTASRLAVASFSTTAGNETYHRSNNSHSVVSAAAMIVFAAGAVASNQKDESIIRPWTVTTTNCDQGAVVVDHSVVSDSSSETDAQSEKENKEEAEEEEDPYENLPEEDEPTDCSMCNTFRQGPCRPYWRKLERCFKDNEKVKDGAVRCVRYFSPHQNCLMQYMNLYLLVGHEMKQEMVQDIELAFSRPEEQRSIDMPTIDWSLWSTFLQEQGPSFRQTVPERSNKETPLWKRVDDDTEPILVNLQSSLPNVDETTGWILKIAYMVDQDGKVLGFLYNEEYGNLMKESKGEPVERRQSRSEQSSTTTKDDETGEATNENQDSSSDALQQKPIAVDFVIMPGETKSIQLKAIYSENPVTAPAEKEVLDGCLCHSSVQSVPGLS